MNTFTASNGILIKDQEAGLTVVCSGGREDHVLTPSESNALREFFRAEEDERLGRWRWPEDPDYVVTTSDQFRAGEREGWAIFTHEPTGLSCSAARSARGGLRVDQRFPEVADAFFAAHPEPKPWHKAEPGQVWLVNGKVRAVVERVREPHTFADPFYREMGIPVTDPSIVDARRITWEPNS